MYWRGGPQPTADLNVTRVRRRGPRRRHDDQLDQLPAHPAVGARAVGAASTGSRASTAPTTTATSTRSSSALLGQRPLLGPERPAPAHEGGRGRARLVVRDDHCATPTRAVTTRQPPAYIGLRRPVGLEAEHAADLPPGRLRRGRRHRRALHRRPRAGRARPRRRRRGHMARPRDGALRARDRARAAGRGRGRLARVAGAAAALADRRPGGRQLPAHPSRAPRCSASTASDQEAWWGAPQAGLVDEFAAVEDGYGFLVETTQYAPALVGSALPFTSAPRHKEMMEKVRYGGTFIGLLRDRGHGHVDVDANGQAVVYYDLTDELDVRNTHRGDRRADPPARRGRSARDPAAGRRAARTRWRDGDDLDACIAHWQRVPLRAGGFRLFCAHQMGTCRMGKDRADERRRPVGRAARHPGRVDRRRQRVPDGLGNEPDDLDHGARAPHRRGDRGRAFTLDRVRRRREPVTDDPIRSSTWQ